MADGTTIEWTDATWNPITGCSIVSAGCDHCYAMRLAGTRMKHHPSRAGLTRTTRTGRIVWNGKVRFNEEWLDQPLGWRKPRLVFVCAHGDLFHEKVPDAWIDRVFAVMALATQHRFQVLTKRPDRMRAYFEGDRRTPLSQSAEARVGMATQYLGLELGEDVNAPYWDAFWDWPLRNVWLGTSVEDQLTADQRIGALLETPAAVRFISAEPLLGPVDLAEYLRCPGCGYSSQDKRTHLDHRLCRAPSNTLDWVIVGGESGPGARPMNPQWARDIRDACAAADVPFHFKQWGEFVSVSEVEGPGDIHKFADERCVRRVGKKLAGRRLDGVEHNGMPAA